MEQQHDPLAPHAAIEAYIHLLGNRITQLENQQHYPPVHHTAPLARPNKPSVYDGTYIANARSWLDEVENYLAATNTIDPNRVPIVISYLRGAASQWWQAECKSRTVTRQATITLWDEFKRAFAARFLPIEASKAARIALTSLRQQRSVADYCSRFQKLMSMIDDMAEADKVEYFTRGLQPLTQKEVVLKCPSTLDEAMHLAARFDILLSSRSFRSVNNYRRSLFYPSNQHTAGYRNTTAYSSSSQNTSQPMDLSQLEQDQKTDALEDGNADEVANLHDGMEQFSYFQSNAPRRAPTISRVPNISKDEFTRCRRLGLCLRCKQSGHIARNCPQPQSHANSYPKVGAQRK